MWITKTNNVLIEKHVKTMHYWYLEPSAHDIRDAVVVAGSFLLYLGLRLLARLKIDASDPHFLTGLTNQHGLIWFSTSRRPQSHSSTTKIGETESRAPQNRSITRQPIKVRRGPEIITALVWASAVIYSTRTRSYRQFLRSGWSWGDLTERQKEKSVKIHRKHGSLTTFMQHKPPSFHL